MSDKEKRIVGFLDKKLGDPMTKKLMRCAIVILVSIILHDGDHVRQAIKWTYRIPISLLAINLSVYVLPVISIFLIRSRRASASLVTVIAGVFTSASFLILHLCGSATGLWGVWNFSYFALQKGVTYNGVYYQGVDLLSWIFLFEVPALCLPSSYFAFRQYLELKKAEQS